MQVFWHTCGEHGDGGRNACEVGAVGGILVKGEAVAC
jgi:hypothetical protein